MAIIVEKAHSKNECVMAFPYGQIEKIQINTGNYRWMLDLEKGTVQPLDLLLNVDKKAAEEIRRAMVQFDEFLADSAKRKAQEKAQGEADAIRDAMDAEVW